MRGISNKVNATMSIGAIAGLGIFSLLMIQSTAVTVSSETAGQPSVRVAPGVKLKFEVDKSIYQTSETVLSALRNDSRKQIWLTDHADGCTDQWWQVQMLQSDGETWRAVALSKETCSAPKYGSQAFTRHTVLTGEWNIRVPGPQLGAVVVPATSGTYRLAALYIAAPQAPTNSDWKGSQVKTAYSQTFTIQ